jgi:hypothetical protein
VNIIPGDYERLAAAEELRGHRIWPPWVMLGRSAIRNERYIKRSITTRPATSNPAGEPGPWRQTFVLAGGPGGGRPDVGMGAPCGAALPCSSGRRGRFRQRRHRASLRSDDGTRALPSQRTRSRWSRTSSRRRKFSSFVPSCTRRSRTSLSRTPPVAFGLTDIPDPLASLALPFVATRSLVSQLDER